jgi:competence protein ComGC
MKGLDEKAVSLIEKLVGERFDNISLQFLGLIPKISKQKKIVFSTSKNNLISLFLQALGTRTPNGDEENVLKTMLRVADGYIKALKEKTQSTIINKINANVAENKGNITLKSAKKVFRDEMDKAGQHFKLIANAESNKATNTGTALQIQKVGESNGESDPTVFFVVHKDEKNHPDTLRLHLLPDGITPRCWLLSELGQEYHKKGDPNPKVQGTHPYCRCKLTYLPKGFSFEGGKISWKSLDWDELKHQRENFEMPKNQAK